MRTRPKDGGGKAKTGALSVLLQTTQDGPASTPDFQVPPPPELLFPLHRGRLRISVTDVNYSILQIISQELISCLNDPLNGACPSRHKPKKSLDACDQQNFKV